MTRRRMEFVVEESDWGGMGFRPRGAAEGWDAVDAQVTTHDFFEHENFHLPWSTEEEGMALGSMLFVRGLGGWFSRHREYSSNPGHYLGNDLAFFANEFETPELVRSTRIKIANVEDWISKGIEAAECEDADNYRNHLRRGFRRAARKYRNVHPAWLTTLYIEMEDKLSELSENFDDSWTGISVAVELDTTKQTVAVSYR